MWGVIFYDFVLITTCNSLPAVRAHDWVRLHLRPRRQELHFDEEYSNAVVSGAPGVGHVLTRRAGSRAGI